MKKAIQGVVVFCCLFGMVTKAISLDESQVIADELQTNAANQLNSFAFNLYRQVDQPSKNWVISPYSLSSLLGRLMVGAGGKTRNQLMSLFQVKSEQGIMNLSDALGQMDAVLRQGSCSAGPLFCKIKQFFFQTLVLNVANAFWADQQLTYKPAFMNAMKQNAAAHFYTMNFREYEVATKKINRWVEDQTNCYIKKLLLPGSIVPTTRLVLTNAIYFKGVWKLPFEAKGTEEQPFVVLPGRSVQAPIMKQKNRFLYAENEVLQMLILRYKKSPLAMAIMLPRDDFPLQAIQEQLTPELFNQWIDGSREQKVSVYLPKFTIESRFESLNTAMVAMGLTDVFNKKANFSQMTDSPLSISAIIQKAFVQVDEEGTLAAEATDFVLPAVASGESGIFNANHPFLFFIFDTRSRLILLMGQVVNPVANQE